MSEWALSKWLYVKRYRKKFGGLWQQQNYDLSYWQENRCKNRLRKYDVLNTWWLGCSLICIKENTSQKYMHAWFVSKKIHIRNTSTVRAWLYCVVFYGLIFTHMFQSYLTGTGPLHDCLSSNEVALMFMDDLIIWGEVLLISKPQKRSTIKLCRFYTWYEKVPIRRKQYKTGMLKTNSGIDRLIDTYWFIRIFIVLVFTRIKTLLLVLPWMGVWNSLL